MNRVQASLATLVLAAGPIAGALAATQSVSPMHTEGWRYGRANCGPITGGLKSELACRVCCNRGAQDGEFPAAEIENCHAFCKIANWPGSNELVPLESPSGAPLPAAAPDSATGLGFVTCMCGT